MDFSIEDRANALAFSTELLNCQIQQAQKGVMNTTAIQLLYIAEEREISLKESFDMVLQELHQNGERHAKIVQKALDAYDQHISDHEDEMVGLNRQIPKDEATIATLESRLKCHKIKRDQQIDELKRRSFSSEQIDQILNNESSFTDEIKLKNEIQSKKLAVKWAKQRLDQIRVQAMEIRDAIICNE